MTTIFEPKPSRVKNIFICAGVVFCASSRITNASLSVRPRMYASGATSTIPASISFGIISGSTMSRNASCSGRKYGSIFSFNVPGRKPNFSPASTAGRVRIMRLTCLACSACTALAMAKYVLPVPAGPRPNTMVFWSMASTYSFWPRVFGRIALPRRVMMFSASAFETDKGASTVTIATACFTDSGLITCPRRAMACSSSSTLRVRAISCVGPVRVTAVPRTKISAASWFSNTFKLSSCVPNTVCATAGSSS